MINSAKTSLKIAAFYFSLQNNAVPQGMKNKDNHFL